MTRSDDSLLTNRCVWHFMRPAQPTATAGTGGSAHMAARAHCLLLNKLLPHPMCQQFLPHW